MDAQVTQVLGTAIAFGLGFLGKKLGDAPATGRAPHDRWIGPIAAVGAGVAFKAVTGEEIDLQQALGGSEYGVQAMGLWAAGKGLWKFGKWVAHDRHTLKAVK